MVTKSKKRDSHRARLLRLVKQAGVIRPRDLHAIGVPREYLRRLRDEGVLEQPARGLYVLAGTEVTEHQSLIAVCKRVPHGVVCLLSALQFHGLTTQLPHEVWIAIGTRVWAPRMDSTQIRVTRFSPTTLAFGVDRQRIGGVIVPVFNPAKTVADCFKFRNKIGLDVAIEALRDCLSQKQATVDELEQAARVCRVSTVLRPYMEAMV